MRSTKFSCERTLFKKDLARFWPLPVAYTVLWFLLIPLDLFSRGERLAQSYAKLNMTGWAGDRALEQVCGWNGSVFAACYAVLCAMAVWSYLYNNRAANMTHALPVRREGHFAAHFLSGVALFALPHVVIGLLTAVAGAVGGSTGDLGGIAAAMGILTLLCLFFFCFATLCAFVTGHILALPVLYCIFNFLVFGVIQLLDWVSSKFLFGVVSGLEQARDAIEWLTPVINLGSALRFCFNYEYAGYERTTYSLGSVPFYDESNPIYPAITREIRGLDVLFIYVVVGLVLAALALLLYRRRHLETAGDVVAVPWLRPVFQYGVAFCAALSGTYITVDILQKASPALLTLLLAVWGVVGYFVARMFLHKTLKVFKSGWKGAAATAAVLLVLCAGLWTDVLGLERRVPDAAQVDAIYISGPQSNPGDEASFPRITITDPAQIEQVLNIHRTIVAHRDELKKAQADYRNRPLDPGWNYTSLRILYYAKAEDDSPFMERAYSVLVLDQEELNDPDSVACVLNEFINDPDAIRLAYNLDHVEPGRMTQVTVNGLYYDSGDVKYTTLYSPLSDYDATVQANEDEELFYYEQSMTELVPADNPSAMTVPTRSDDYHLYRPATLEELGEIWNAVLADFDEGNLGKRWLFNTDEFRENTCITSLQFQYQVKMERVGEEDYYREYETTIQLTPQARHTLEALEELGIFEDGGYVSGMSADMERVYPVK